MAGAIGALQAAIAAFREQAEADRAAWRGQIEQAKPTWSPTRSSSASSTKDCCGRRVSKATRRR
jgi:hypothetical protein